MIKHRIKKSLRLLSGICLMLLAVVSCTKDYFLEETTFRLHIPQLEDTSTDRLSDLYVFFHNAQEDHVITRKVDSTTRRDPMMQQGILRFKIPPGHGYTATCIANTQNYIVDGGKTLRSAFISAEPWESSRASGRAYKTISRTGGIRILSHNPVTVFPINHPDGKIPHEANMSDSTEYASKVTLGFTALPAMVARVEVEYYGLATHFSLHSGEFTRMDPTDYYLSKTPVSEMDGTTTKSFTNSVFPSDGASVRTTGAEQPINLVIRFFDATGNVVMVHSLDDHGYPQHSIGGVTHPRWDPSMGIATKPQIKVKNKDHLTLTFNGWTIIGLTLQGWGDIIDGPITPM